MVTLAKDLDLLEEKEANLPLGAAPKSQSTESLNSVGLGSPVLRSSNSKNVHICTSTPRTMCHVMDPGVARTDTTVRANQIEATY